MTVCFTSVEMIALAEHVRAQDAEIVGLKQQVTLNARVADPFMTPSVDACRAHVAKEMEKYRQDPAYIPVLPWLMPVPKHGVDVDFIDNETDEVIDSMRLMPSDFPVGGESIAIGDHKYFVEVVHRLYLPSAEKGGEENAPSNAGTLYGAHVHLEALNELDQLARAELADMVADMGIEAQKFTGMISEMLDEAMVERTTLVEIANDINGAHELTARINITRHRATELLLHGVLTEAIDGPEDDEVH